MGEFIMKLLAEAFEGIAYNLWPVGTSEAWKQNLAIVLGTVILILGAVLVIYYVSR
jgi:hypothetical protein